MHLLCGIFGIYNFKGWCCHTDPSKVEVIIMNWPTPYLVREAREFLGLIGWYCIIIVGYAKIASPITSILRKSVAFIWTIEWDESFKDLKITLPKALILRLVDFTKLFTITIHASRQAIGGVLTQNLELLVIVTVHALNMWRH